MLEIIKKSMRITHGQFDMEIQNNIEAALLDLKRVGIPSPDEENALILKAVELYCKWQYDFGGNGERFEKSYTELTKGLALCGDYNVRRSD